jgi:DNA primase
LDAKQYYDRITSIDIGTVARELLGDRVTEESSQRLHVDCPHHASESGTSLHVDLGKGLWHCFGCQVGGDVIQLVEFINTGQITKGVTGVMTDSHRAARDWLGSLVDLPPLNQAGLTPEEAKRVEERRIESERVFAALTHAADVYHQTLLNAPEVLRSIEETWGFGIDVVREFKIGYANAPDLMSSLLAAGFDKKTALGTGCFTIDAHGNEPPFFDRRIIFPYWSRGRVVYMIGRRTEWSDERDRAKYKKLPVHHPDHRKYVSPAISNSVVFGEDVLSSRPKEVSITEGITDAIATQRGGFPCISPVTVGFKKDDIEGLVKRLRGVSRVYLVQDNEFSGVGLKGALTTARLLGEKGIECHVGLIPVPERQAKARRDLEELMGPQLSAKIRNADPARRAKLLDAELPEEHCARGAELRAQSKVDLCEWWSLGGTAAGYEKILAESRTVMEVAIDTAPIIEDDRSAQVESIEDLLTEIGLNSPTRREDLLKRLKGVIGIPLSLLRAEAGRFAKKQKEKERDSASKDSKAPGVLAALADAQPGSLKEMLTKMIAASQANQQPISWERMGSEAYEWFRSQGAIFFRSYDGVPFIFFESRTYCMAGGGGEKIVFEGFMFKQSGLVPVSAGARTFFIVLRSLAVERGDIRTLPTWVQTHVDDRTIYVNLNNSESQVASISPEGVRVNANGNNTHRAILSGTSKFEPLVIPAGVMHERLEDAWQSFIGRHLATDDLSRRAIFTWTVLYPMVEYVGTRPMMRFEGAPGSGKTWAAKMLTTLVFGDDHQKKGTTAANYVDASTNPLVALDNVEMANVTPDLIDFLLTVVTGIRREKRRGNTDTDTVSERPVSLILTTGVEPLGGDLAEIMSRSLVIPFDKSRQDDALVEREVLARIKEARNDLMAMAFGRCARVLELIDEHDALSKVMVAITSSLGSHSKRRCNEWLALMFLVEIANQPEERLPQLLEELTPSFKAMILAINEESEAVARGSSSIGLALSALFTAIRAGGSDAADEFGITMNETGSRMVDVLTRDLFIALRSVSRSRNIEFGYRNAQQFGRRFGLEIAALGDEGFTITSRVGRGRKKFFSISGKKLTPETQETFVNDEAPADDPAEPRNYKDDPIF